ncbi:unnamed protein product, partial [Iphiclides podalirius]
MLPIATTSPPSPGISRDRPRAIANPGDSGNWRSAPGICVMATQRRRRRHTWEAKCRAAERFPHGHKGTS